MTGGQGPLFVEVALPAALYRAAESYIAGTEFSTVSAFVAFVLSEVLAEDESEAGYSDADASKVRDRLERLGYVE